MIRKLTMIQAITEAMDQKLAEDSRVMLLGEDVGVNGGVFRATEDLIHKYGANRVVDTPLSEAGIIGAAIGMAMNGLIPIVEIQFLAFIYPGFEQIVSHAARMRYRTRGQYHVPMVIRTPYGAGIRGPELHSESVETFFAHVPGLKVVAPSTPYDAKGLLIAAIEDPDPVIFLAGVEGENGAAGDRSAIDAFAAALDHAVAVLLLAVALDLAAGRTTGNSTCHGSELLAIAAAHLVAQQAADHRAGRSTGNAVRIARVALHFHVLADHAAAIVELASLIARPIGLRAGHRRSRQKGAQHKQSGRGLHGHLLSSGMAQVSSRGWQPEVKCACPRAHRPSHVQEENPRPPRSAIVMGAVSLPACCLARTLPSHRRWPPVSVRCGVKAQRAGAPG